VFEFVQKVEKCIEKSWTQMEIIEPGERFVHSVDTSDRLIRLSSKFAALNSLIRYSTPSLTWREEKNGSRSGLPDFSSHNVPKQGNC
jgi:hypothetical protein